MSVTLESVEVVAVLGAGTMGSGIAQSFATAGFSVRLYDVEDSFALRGKEKITLDLENGVKKGKVSLDLKEKVLARIKTNSCLIDSVSGADVVIEAIPEKADLKKALFESMHGHLSSNAVLATNTSSLSIDSLASSVPFCENFLGLHFFNPPQRMRLLEIIRGSNTNQAILNFAKDLAKHLGKTPIVVSDSPGFASSRLGVTLGLEAMRMVEEGVASAADIDIAMELGYRHPMGPLKLTDLVGLDVRLDIAEHLAQKLQDVRFAPPRILRDKVARGELGTKTGQGFHRWKDGQVQE